jgi:Carbohydrate binding domain.
MSQGNGNTDAKNIAEKLIDKIDNITDKDFLRAITEQGGTRKVLFRVVREAILRDLIVDTRNRILNSTGAKDAADWVPREQGVISVVEGYAGQKGLRFTRSGYSGSNRAIMQGYLKPEPLKAGTRVYASAWVKVESSENLSNAAFVVRDEVPASQVYFANAIIPPAVGGWVKIEASYTLTADSTGGKTSVLVAFAGNGTIVASQLFFSHSSVPVAWSPAPEDFA